MGRTSERAAPRYVEHSRKIHVNLQAGRNSCLVKILRTSSAWQFALKTVPPERAVVEVRNGLDRPTGCVGVPSCVSWEY